MSTNVASEPVKPQSVPAAIEHLWYDYQPIVNVHTGALHGVEALLRGTAEAGFTSIQHFFDQAFEDGVLPQIEADLLGVAIRGLADSSAGAATRLFYNVDNRALMTAGGARLTRLLDEFDLDPDRLHIEISERHWIDPGDSLSQVLGYYKRGGLRVVVDDFGIGYSGLQLLHRSEPDVVKIDRFFIDGIDTDSKKRLVVANVVSIAHILGASVVAEGVETEAEFYTCRNAGCDFAQGFLVARPQPAAALESRYDHVAKLVAGERRRDQRHPGLVAHKMEHPHTVEIGATLIEILTLFRNNAEAAFFPVLSRDGEPLGLIRERDLKSYVYSPYGISLLMNQTQKRHIQQFIHRAPTTDVHTPIDTIIELYATDPDAEAVIVTEDGSYRGVLSSRALLEVISEQEIARARDQNPLSRLPGNNVINEFIAERLDEHRGDYLFAYLDFDNFKAFNDAYGFRSGDRVITLFADTLKELQHHTPVFVGHIGGDDFFLGIDLRDAEMTNVTAMIRQLIDRFTSDARAFYSTRDRERGYLLGHGRDGTRRRFGLLGLSAAVLVIETDNHSFSADDLAASIAKVKKRAKRSASGIATTSV